VPRAKQSPVADYVVLGPAASWSPAHDRALAVAIDVLGCSAIPIDGRVVARLPVEPFDGINRWRWLAVALSRPVAVGTPAWRRAALGWAPSVPGGTVRVITERRWSELTGQRA
jgi:hypothetical protein